MGSKRCRVHRYYRVELQYAGKVWACRLCDHYMPAHLENLVYSKLSRCNECDELFKMDRTLEKEEFPKCLNCRYPEADKLGMTIEQYLVMEQLKKTGTE